MKKGGKNVKWGSPLETIGDYMRTLNRISYPNQVAAWTQAMADDWGSRARKNAGNPNNLEMRIQAYEAIANGATSLYWFNMGGKTVINNRGQPGRNTKGKPRNNGGGRTALNHTFVVAKPFGYRPGMCLPVLICTTFCHRPEI
ncbi:MAG: hypothetical protein IPF54_23835 [Draconibacterium sp.]|nr:hypothetical protein [Draconibacterium sp.]